MIYKGLNRIGMIGDIKTKGGGEIAEVYGGIGESDPIYYKQREMVGTSPMQFKALGLPLKDYRIYGETLQDGTPSPDMPVDVVGCGAKTGNLVRFYQEEVHGNFYGVDVTLKNAEITLNGTVTAGQGHWVEIGYKFGGKTEPTDNVVIPCEPETPYTIATEILGGNSSEVRLIAFGTSDGNKLINIGSSLTTIFDNDINRIFISLGAEGVVFNNLKIRVMLNKGSTALPYEPYGYKLPVTTTNGTNTVTTPIYVGSEPIHRLGEYADYVDYSSGKIVRRIKKLVLTGEETWVEYTSIADCYSLTIRDNPGITGNGICSHYAKAETTLQLTDGTFVSGQNFLYFKDVSTQNLDGWKSYLAAQYTAGTPVTVWYVLSEPIEEDPPISFPELTTLSGTNTLTVDTTIKPSEIDLTGRIKTSGYGQLLDKNSTAINDSTGTPIFIRG